MYGRYVVEYNDLRGDVAINRLGRKGLTNSQPSQTTINQHGLTQPRPPPAVQR